MKQKKLYDFLFVFTEKSQNEGEEFLVEETTLENAIKVLTQECGFKRNEFKFLEKMELGKVNF